MEPLVSIIVPMYNVEAYVVQCLQSLLAQTYTNWEAICVDDCSTDATFARAKEVAGTDSRFVFLQHEKNSGLSTTRNTGLAKARGAYIAFLDSDDYFIPNTLERLVKTTEENKLDLLDFTGTALYESTDLQKSRPEDFYMNRTSIEGVLSGPELFCQYQRLKEYCCPVYFHFIRRQLLVDNNLEFYPGILHEDELFSPLLHAYANRAMFLNESLYMRRIRNNSIVTTKRGIENVRSVFVITNELQAWLEQHANNYNQDFINAFTQRIWELRGIMAEDILQCSQEELGAFQNELTPKDHIAFSLYGIQRAREVQQQQEFYTSKTWKLANSLASVSRKMRGISAD